MTTQYARATRVWQEQRWVAGALLAFNDHAIWLAADAEVGTEPVGTLPANVLPPLTDAHVHLGLSDFAARGGGVLARVLDLGWEPGSLRAVAAAQPGTEVRYAGTFLTAPAGYPSMRPWAPAGSVTEVAGVEHAAQVVDHLRDLGASVVKVVLNSDVGPVLTDEVLRVIVSRAHELGLPVVAHVEGAGQPHRAASAGVDAFAHTPWTHRLTDDELGLMAGRMRWISTLDMHGRGHYGDDFAAALDNLARFSAHGGTVVYGTDLGNDLSQAGFNTREVAALRSAGLDGAALVDAMTATGLLPSLSPAGASPASITLLPEDVVDPDDVVEALPSSRPVPATRLKEHLR
jgi:imidazolonepropionase-like amidohydrolase